MWDLSTLPNLIEQFQVNPRGVLLAYGLDTETHLGPIQACLAGWAKDADENSPTDIRFMLREECERMREVTGLPDKIGCILTEWKPKPWP